jgi:hypothetical protein
VISKLIVGAACACLAAASFSSSAAIVVDTEFNDTDWSSTKVIDTTAGSTATSTSTQQLSGGNPDAYRQTIHDWTVTVDGVNIEFAHVFTPTSYDPGSLGAIDALVFDMDAKVDLAEQVNGIGFRFLVEQDGTFYASDATTILVGTGWNDISATLSEADFVVLGGVGNPDFSTSGSPIRFGYVTRNGGSNTGRTLQSVGGVDNWSVSVVPVPAAAWLFGSGLIGLIGIARRKKA